MPFSLATKKYPAPMQTTDPAWECLEKETTIHQKRKCWPTQKPKSYWHILLKRKSQMPCRNIPHEIQRQFQIHLLQRQMAHDWFQPHWKSNTLRTKAAATANTNAIAHRFVSSPILTDSSCQMLKSHPPVQILRQFHMTPLVLQNVMHQTMHILNSMTNHQLKCRKHP